MTTYISDADLRKMTLVQLNHGLLTDVSNGHRYRHEITRRVAACDPEAVAAYNGKPSRLRPAPGQKAPPDIRDEWLEVKRDQQPMTRMASIILNSGWDYTDPIHKMTMPPEAVEDFLKGLEYQPDQYYSELPEEMKRVVNMIFDVYGRWYRSRV